MCDGIICKHITLLVLCTLLVMFSPPVLPSSHFQGIILLHPLSVLKLLLLMLFLIYLGCLKCLSYQSSLVSGTNPHHSSGGVILCSHFFFHLQLICSSRVECFLFFFFFSHHPSTQKTLMDICDEQIIFKFFILRFLRGSYWKLTSYSVFL